MAKKTYSQRNQESIQRYGKTLYERRIESGQNKGLSIAKARGHKELIKAPPITEKVIKGPSNSVQVASTRFSDITKQLNKLADNQRVYFSFWDNRTGKYIDLYKGKGKSHGVTVGYLKERIADVIANGEAKTMREAMLIVFKDDIAGASSGGDTPDDLALPQVITQIRLHAQPLGKAA